MVYTNAVADTRRRWAQDCASRDSTRIIAPDLARGTMLLLIAVANAVGAVYGGQPGYETNPQGIERWLNAFLFVMVHARAYPVFAVMFGYGVVQLASAYESRGDTLERVRHRLTRRYVCLFLFGVLHGILLYFGDFLGAYGVVGVICTWVLLNRRERVLRLVLWLWVIMLIEVVALAGFAMFTWSVADRPAPVPFETVPSFSASSYAGAVAMRMHEWPRHTLKVTGFIVVVALGIWAGRRRLLEERRHRRSLITVAAVCLAITWFGGLPIGLIAAGIISVGPATAQRLFLLDQVSGMFGGPGYVALLALIAAAIEQSGNGVNHFAVKVVCALGQRSLSAYVLQSVIWIALFAPYCLDLGRHVQSRLILGMCAAITVWVASLALAYTFDRRGWRGPLESLLRRLAT